MKPTSLLVLILLIGSTAAGQGPDEHQFLGYGFVAPGGASGGGVTNSTLQLGGGAEGLLYKGLGVGGELGYLGPTSSFVNGFGVFSVNGLYQVGPRDGKAVPFVTSGYSLGFRSGSINMWNFGGGVSYWVLDRLGVRFEFRDHVHFNPNVHYWGFRIGLAFR